MPPVISRYPLDTTGVSSDNLVQGELHTMIHRKVRAIAPTYGAFFSQSVVVVDNANQQQLVKDAQFYCAELYELPSARYGKEICAIILITDKDVSDSVTISYQALGGEFGTSQTAILQMIETLSLDTRPAVWPELVGRPDEFPPSHHLHDAGDIYGFEYVVHALDRIRAVLEFGDDISHDAIYKYIDDKCAGYKLVISAMMKVVFDITDLQEGDILMFIGRFWINVRLPTNQTLGSIRLGVLSENDMLVFLNGSWRNMPRPNILNEEDELIFLLEIIGL